MRDFVDQWLTHLADLELDEKHLASRVNEANRLRKAGHLEAARALIENVLDEDDHFRPAHAASASLAMEQRRWAEARQALLRAQREGEATREWILISRIELQSGDHAAAERATMLAIRRANDDEELIAGAIHALEVGNLRLAAAAFKAVAEHDGDPVAFLGRAVVAHRSGDIASSAEWLALGETNLLGRPQGSGTVGPTPRVVELRHAGPVRLPCGGEHADLIAPGRR